MINNLPISDAGEWLFYPGMLFGSHAKWWADWGCRYTPHEGVDIAFYRTSNKHYRTFNKDIATLDSTVMVPAMADGVILNICDDFLGQSVVVAHGTSCSDIEYDLDHSHPDCCIDKSRNGRKESITGAVYSHICIDSSLARLYSGIYADSDSTEPDSSYDKKPQKDILKKRLAVSRGQVIGKIADTSMKKSGILPHLHISFIEIPSTTPFNELNWNLFGNPDCDNVRFLNPLW
ncbi:MAG: hypothetical protein HQK61_06010 [Desulfamplus sp.]|nr:hypothetical protein [Desulfamplus sp.]